MLEKEFVPHQESLELKELGFDEPCLTYYFSDGAFNDAAEEDNTLYPGDPRFYSDTNSSLAEYCENELKYKAISAPTFSQAFRFFREKYDLHQDISTFVWDYDKEQLGFSLRTYLNPLNTTTEKKVHPEVYETYEEAELECLRKLIEIAKNK
jgi:hypothetical protein